MISISKDNYEKILAHAEKNLPEEACGLIAGEVTAEGKVIREVYLLTNIDHSNEHFSLDPKEQLVRRWVTGILIRNPLRARRKKTSVLPTIPGRAT